MNKLKYFYLSELGNESKSLLLLSILQETLGVKNQNEREKLSLPHVIYQLPNEYKSWVR